MTPEDINTALLHVLGWVMLSGVILLAACGASLGIKYLILQLVAL